MDMQNRTEENVIMPLSISLFADIAFILYFSFRATSTMFGFVLGQGTLANVLGISLPYLFAAFCILLQPKEYISWDFLCLYGAILLFILVTALIHPNYIPFYNRDVYGVWSHVLHPFRGIYSFFFMRLIKQPKRVLKLMRIAGWIMVLYFGYQLRLAAVRGYWMGQGRYGAVQMSYSVSFGYEALPFMLVFLYLALTKRKWFDIAGVILYSSMILVGGSRGPFLFIGEFVILFIMTKLQYSKKKIIIIVCIVIVGSLLYLFYDILMQALIDIVSKLGFSSRFLKSLVNGSVANDNGRNEIWQAALQMIKLNPWGYGAMGSRHMISSVIYVGYPHSIVLEMLIDYGVIVGGFFLMAMAVGSYRILFGPGKNGWSEVFLPFFCSASCLLISMTYWSVPTFWACLAIAVNYHIAQNDPYQILYRFLGITQ